MRTNQTVRAWREVLDLIAAGEGLPGLVRTANARIAAEQQKAPGVVGEAVEVWEGRFGLGSAPAGRLGAAVAPLAKIHGREVVMRALRIYVVRTTHPCPSPQDFRAHFADWVNGGPRTAEERRDEERRSRMRMDGWAR